MVMISLEIKRRGSTPEWLRVICWSAAIGTNAALSIGHLKSRMGMGARWALFASQSDPFERIAKPGDMSFDIRASVARRKMASRFVAQRQNDGKYCVWDNQNRAVAHSDSQTRYKNLEFNQAIDAAMELNGPGRAADTSDQR
jgi:hypothetical protein